jgi:hypothetical protein
MATVVEYVVRADTKPAVRSLEKLGDETLEAGRDAKKAQRDYLQMASQIGNAVTGMAAGFAVVRGAVTTFTSTIQRAGKATFDFAHNVVDSVNQLNDLNARSGLTAGSIQAVIQAFEGSGQAAAQAEAFISRIPRTFADLAIEGSRASIAAEQLGVKLRDANGDVKNADKLLVEITRAFQGITNDTERATTAFLLFGRSAGQFLQAFGKTAEFEKFLAFTNEFGVQTGPKATQEAAAFQELISALNTTFKGTAQRIAESIGLTTTFNNALISTIGFLVGIQTMVTSNGEQFDLFGQSITKIGSGLIKVFQMVGSFVGSILTVILGQIGLMIGKVGVLLELVGAAETGAGIRELGEGLIGTAQAALAVDTSTSSQTFKDGKKRAKELMESILAGLDDATKKTKFNFDDLSDSLNNTTEAAEKTKKAIDPLEKFFGGQERTAKALSDIGKFQIQVFETFNFDELDKELKKFDDIIAELTNGIELLDEVGLSTATSEKLLAQATQKRAEAVQNAADKERKALAERVGEVVSFGVDAFKGIFSSVLGGGLAGFGNVLQASSALIEKGVGQLSTTILTSLGVASAGPIGVVIGQAVGQIVSTLGQSINTLLQTFQGLGTFSDEAGARARAKKRAQEQGISFAEALEDERKKEIANEVRQQTEAIKLGFQILPELLFETLPPILNEFLIEFGQLLFTLPDRLVEAFQRSFSRASGMSSENTTLENIQALGRFLLPSGTVGPDGISIRGPGILSAQGGVRFTGADQGLAMLHRGEFVVPETNIAPQAVQRRLDREVGGGSGVTININAEIVERSAVDELVNRIEQRFLTFGANTSPLFGGA